MNRYITFCVVLFVYQYEHDCAEAIQNNLQNKNPRPEVKDTCEKQYGTVYFTAKHGQPSHHNHPQDRHQGEIDYLRELISCGYEDDEATSALSEAVFHVRARLGRLHLQHNQHIAVISEQMENQTESFIASYFKNVSIWDPRFMTDFWKCVIQGPSTWQPHPSTLQSQASDPVQHASRIPPRCGLDMPPNHPPPNHPPQNPPPHQNNQHGTDIKSLFDHVRASRLKKEIIPETKNAFKYYNLAKANRLMCVYMEDIVSPLGRPIPPHEQVVMLVKYILMGYNFKHANEVCPVTFIQNVYKYGALSKDTTLTEIELNTLIHNIHLSSGESTDQPATSTPHQQNDHHSHNTHNQPSTHPSADEALSDWRPFHPQQPPFRMDTRSSLVHQEQSPLTWTNVGRTVEQPLFNKCLTSKQIFNMFKKDRQHIDGTTFLDICPVLLEQMLKNDCRNTSSEQLINIASSNAASNSTPTDAPAHVKTSYEQLINIASSNAASNSTPTDAPADVKTSHEQLINIASSNAASNSTPTDAPADVKTKAYLYGSLSVFLISLCSCFGAVFLKLGNELVKHYIMGSLLALAVGCLVADAVLHLLPEISGMEDNEEDEDGSLLPKGLQKLCALIACIYGFFLLELYLSTRSNHGHSHGPQLEPPKDETVVIKECNIDDAVSRDIFKNNRQKGQRMSSDDPHPAKFKKLNNIMVYNIEGATNNPIEMVEMPRDTTQQSEITLSKEHSKTTNKPETKGKIAIAWMVIIGDGIHNFADGLAIGAAFSLSFTKGLSTAITVLCHELPHELGDFAVLVSSGLSIKRAMLFNFLSSLTAFAGLYIGLALGDQPEACQWIFSAGAGMFLYVAMADLIPEIKVYFQKTPDWKMFLGQNFGWLIGYLGMLLIAMFEDKLGID